MASNSSIDDLLEQAQLAAQQGQWSWLAQCLQQIQTLSRGVPDMTVAWSESSPDCRYQQLLAFALNVLEMGDFYDRWEITKVFPAFGTVAIPALVEILQDADADWELRWFAARILGECNHPTVIDSLMGLLQAETSQDEELTAIIAEALANLGTPAVAALAELLTSSTTRLVAVKALAQIHQPEIIPPLLAIVSDPQISVRMTAIEALSSFSDVRVIPVLFAALDDPVASVRREAVIGVGLRADLVDAGQLVELLHDRLQDANLAVRQQAIITLGRLGTVAAATVLFQNLTHLETPAALHLEIIRALSWIRVPESLSYLRQALLQYTANSSLTREIVVALGRFKQPELQPIAVETLLDLCYSSRYQGCELEIKQAITVSLGELGHPQGIECLIQLMADPDLSVQLHAIAALKKLDFGGTSRQYLQTLAHDTSVSPELRQTVALALQEW
ncbi:hypothetical protein BST81_15975 [Leptolyngbya sp. 'hensonii']|uniref:HEAT repeat domain-containing protein n=1 Tax=Leptolyngbya sp. 'hensonii' TaxID=1922337 RepID=UPI00094F764D|nr:HEAT repeat domain-containing protein [Leptolyngbya sp. 'hensonii']OLP17307.1 hypothetical protein BST81_15975 [Leptolyngbya sp. 'hensonii']